MVFWRLWQESSKTSIVNLALCLAAGTCGLAILQLAHTSSPPPLALGTMPGPPQAVNHVSRPREQSRALEQLG